MFGRGEQLAAAQPAGYRKSALASYALCKQLEAQLQRALQTHKAFDQPVRHLRLQLRSAYATVLLHDLSLAEVGLPAASDS